MRVPLMPLAMALAVGGLLYAAFQGNQRILQNIDPAARPATTAAPTAPTSSGAPDAPDAPGAPGAPDTPDAESPPLDTTALDERCAAIAAAAETAALALDAAVALEDTLRKPVIAFEDDPTLRAELEQTAREIYATPPGSPPAAQRAALQAARCR